jgi:hypothetical protein
VAVGYGAPAAAELRVQVASAKADDPLAPVTVVVPSNYVGVAARRRLASAGDEPLTAAGRGVAGVSFLTVYRLAELLGAASLAAEGRRPVSTPVIGAAIRRVLRADPGVFASVAAHPATEEALVASYQELADLPGGHADALAATGRRANDVVRLVRAARSLLSDRWYDEADLMARAASLAPTAPLAGELGTVILHLPQALSAGPIELMRAVADRGPVVVIAGVTGDDDADAEVRRSVERLGPDPVLFDTAVRPALLPGLGVEITSSADADDEVRGVVRRIVAALGGGTPLDRIGVLYGNREPYARLLHEHLTAAGIPYNGSAVRTVAERLAGRTLLDALELEDEDFRRRDVMALLTDAPVRDAEGRYQPTAAWERISRHAGVVRGRRDWDVLLETWAADLAAAADREAAEPESREWLVEKRRREAERARSLRIFVLDLADRLDQLEDAGTWERRCRQARALLVHLVGSERRRGRWPEPERRAAEKVEAALDRLAGLDEVADAPSAEEFRRTLQLELDSDLGRVGRLGEGLVVGTLGIGLGLEVDLTFVVGMAEGLLPARVREDTMLHDREREATGGWLPLATDRVHTDHRRLLAALAAARSRVVLSYPRGDLRRSAERVPSRWLVELASERAGRKLWSGDLAEGAADVDHVPSFAAGVARLSFPSTHQEYVLRALDTERRAGRAVASHPVVAGSQVLTDAFDLVACRRGRDFTRFDGNLSSLAVPSPVDEVMSPTRFEAYTACPHRYLYERILGIEETEDPEERLELTATDKGSLVHKILEDFLIGVLEEGAPEPAEPWSTEHRALLDRIAKRHCERYEAKGLVGRPLFWERDRRRIFVDLQRFLDRDAQQRAELGARPLAAELGFGLRDSPLGPIELEIDGGRRVRFRGSADRVDERADGGLVVTDYKTGSDAAFNGLSEDDPDKAGRKLQLPVYGLAARVRADRPEAAVRAQYWFITSKRKFKRVGFEVTDTVYARYRTVIGAIVDLIEAGIFPARPPASSYSGFTECPFCDPDGVGTTDVARAWEAKSGAPELADLLALIEPNEGEADE